MCLILFAYQHSDNYKLVLIANRDEYYQREAKPAAFWPHHPHIFGGIDCTEGGSWLSVDTAGRFAAITNIRKPPFTKNNERSRGHIINDFLSSQQSASEFMEELKQTDTAYGLFNLLLLDASGLWHYSSDSHQEQHITPGIHGLCNASLNTPWPKLTRGCDQLKQQLALIPTDNNQLFSIVQSTQQASDSQLPNTGIDLELERFLSPTFIQGDDYGTRCSTLLTIDHNNCLELTELTYDNNGIDVSQVHQTIHIQDTTLI
mgnify:CR=1 FL=1